MRIAAIPARHLDALGRAVDCAGIGHGAPHDTGTLTLRLYDQWFTRLCESKASGWESATPFLTRLRQAWAHAVVTRHRADMWEAIERQNADASTGYWGAWSADGQPEGPGTIRVYWNARQQGTPGLVHAMVLALPPAAAWSLKVPLWTEGFQRCDTVVLYLAPSLWPALRVSLRGVATAHRHALVRQVPPLTTSLADGVATAVDPGRPGESFGMALCRCVAEVIAHRSQTVRADSREEAVKALAERLYGTPCAGPTHAARVRARSKRHG